ncbi:LysR family transcriptional regulator [Novosphingobium sp. B 225]|uniref:LysR family transcriptional regulator n=1 Tax=Novosphingobium sp. B 225 TaxID=1961849 RepID=UPI000B4BDA78|nr:LysR family transcriptional regulator [Novosphingobium sp. B 225]
MHFEGLDLNLLVALDALLSEQSVTRAASRLCVTQPAVSVALQKLRVQFSDPLLERVGRRMELTPFARELVIPVKELLHQIRTVVESRSGFDPQCDSRNFRLLMSSSIAEIFGVPALRELRGAAPNVHCQVDVFVAPDMLRRLQDGEIDLCIQVFQPGVWEQVSDIESISHEALFSDHYVLVGDASNRLLANGLDFDAFCRIDHIETRFGGNLMSLPERGLAGIAKRPKTPLIVPTYNLAIAAVLGSQMTAIVPSRVAGAPWLQDKLSIVEPPFEIGPLEQHMIWHKRNDNDPGHSWFRGFLGNFGARNMTPVV